MLDDTITEITNHLSQCPIGWYNGKIIFPTNFKENDFIEWKLTLDRLVSNLYPECPCGNRISSMEHRLCDKCIANYYEGIRQARESVTTAEALEGVELYFKKEGELTRTMNNSGSDVYYIGDTYIGSFLKDHIDKDVCLTLVDGKPTDDEALERLDDLARYRMGRESVMPISMIKELLGDDYGSIKISITVKEGNISKEDIERITRKLEDISDERRKML